MEEKLRRSEERYRLMADNIRDLIWTMDLRMNLVYVSPSMETMYGYTPEETKGFRFEKLLTPDSVQKVLAQADQLIGKSRLEKILAAIGIRKPAPSA